MSTEPGSDPIGDFQRWLMRAGARSIGKDVAGRVRSTFGGGSSKQTDVWETATTEELTDEPPECQWCPICRAARRYRDAGGQGQPPAFGGQFGGMGDTLAGLTRDAFSLFDAAVKASQRPPAGRPAGPGAANQANPANQTTPANPAAPPPAGHSPSDHSPSDHSPSDHSPSDHSPSDHGPVVVGPGVGWPAVVHPEYQNDEPADEGGHREEGGQPGDGGAGGGTDEQVERTAE
jgi:hypothetical protein